MRKGRAPPGGPNSFNFMQFLGKFGKIVCWRPPGELAPPPRGNPGSATDIIQHKLNTNINLFKTWWEIMIAENLTVNQKQSLNMYVDPDKFNIIEFFFVNPILSDLKILCRLGL